MINNTIGWVPSIYSQSEVSGGSTQKLPYGTYYYLDKLNSIVGLDIFKRSYERQRAIYKLDSSGQSKRIFDRAFTLSTNLIISPDGTKAIDPKAFASSKGEFAGIYNLKTGKSWKLELERFQSKEGFVNQNLEKLDHRNQDQWSPDGRYFLTTSYYDLCIDPCVWGDGRNIVGQKLLKLDAEEFKMETLAETKMLRKDTGGSAAAGTYNYWAINKSIISMPSYSPDGTKIAYKSRVMVGKNYFESDQIEVIDANTKKKLITIQTPASKSAFNYTNSISHYFWSEDSKAIVYINSEKTYTFPDQRGERKLLSTNEFIGVVDVTNGEEITLSEENLGLGNLELDTLGNPHTGYSSFIPWRARLIGPDLIFVYKTNSYKEFLVYRVSLEDATSTVKKLSRPKESYQGYLKLFGDYPILSRDGKWIIWGTPIENIETGEIRTIISTGEFLDWFIPLPKSNASLSVVDLKKKLESLPEKPKGDTADWETLKSEYFNYSINYPADWPVFRSSTNLTSDFVIELVHLNREKGKESKTEKPYINIIGNFQGGWCENNENSINNPNICIQKEVELGGKKGKKWLNTGNYDEIYQVDLAKDKLIVIFVNYGNNKNLTNQVLSTLKFL